MLNKRYSLSLSLSLSLLMILVVSSGYAGEASRRRRYAGYALTPEEKAKLPKQKPIPVSTDEERYGALWALRQREGDLEPSSSEPRVERPLSMDDFRGTMSPIRTANELLRFKTGHRKIEAFVRGLNREDVAVMLERLSQVESILRDLDFEYRQGPNVLARLLEKYFGDTIVNGRTVSEQVASLKDKILRARL